MAGELIIQASVVDVFREQTVGYTEDAFSVLTGSCRGMRLNKFDVSGYNVITRIPLNITLTTGLTFVLGFTDNNEFPSDLGRAVVFGITVKRLAAGNTYSLDTGTGLAAEVLVTATLQAATGARALATQAIANASLPAGLVVGDSIAARIRRNGSNAADTMLGSLILTDFTINNT